MVALLATVALSFLPHCAFGQDSDRQPQDSQVGPRRVRTTFEPVDIAGRLKVASQDKPDLLARTALAGARLFAYLQIEEEVFAREVFPTAAPRLYRLDQIGRRVLEADHRLGPLHLSLFLHHDEGSKHLEGTVLFKNSESTDPVGLVTPTWIGLGVIMPEGASFSARHAVPYGIEPYFLPGTENRVSTWKLAHTSEIRGGNLVPMSFVISYGNHAYTRRVLFEEPDHIRMQGEGLIPSPVLTSEAVAEQLRHERSRWAAFQADGGVQTKPVQMFGYSKRTGAAGAQKRLGKHPVSGITNAQVLSAFASDRHRGEILWVEGLRQHWYENTPLLPANDEGSACFFEGLHFSSHWLAGYEPDGMYREKPFKGPKHGVTGYNLEHSRSPVNETARATQDPALMYMAAQYGRVLFSQTATHTIREGGYYSGFMASFRSWGRPTAELMQTVLALESYQGGPYAELAAFLREHLDWHLQRWERTNPRFSMTTNRADGWVPGHDGDAVTETWQLGIAGDYFHSWSLLNDGPGAAAASALARNCQLAHIQGWTDGDATTTQMPKFSLAADWTVAGPYSRRFDGLVFWNGSLLALPGLAGIDQERLGQLHGAVLIEYPGYREGKWGHGDWNDHEPARWTPRTPWFMMN